MAEEFDAVKLVPRHINKLITQSQQKPILQHQHNANNITLDQPISHIGSVGSSEDYHLYPDSLSMELRKALAKHHTIDADKIFVGNGADEIIDLVIRAFAAPCRDQAITFAPTSPKFLHFASLNGITVNEVPLSSVSKLPIYQAKTAISSQTKILYISNPNPITGVALRNIDIVDILDAFEGIVIVDESGIDYADEASLLSIQESYPNLVIVQTFSQAWGLAGLRLGVAYGHPSVISILNTIKPPFNVNIVAQQAGIRALEVAHEKASAVSDTRLERERVREVLEGIGWIHEVIPSDSNFLLVKVQNPTKVATYLAEEGIHVLDVSQYNHCPDAVRITIGTTAQNDKLMMLMHQLPSKTSATRRFLKGLSRTIRKAGVFMGFFKKIIGGA